MRNSANPSELQVLQGKWGKHENVFDPGEDWTHDLQLSYKANWGAGHERFGILVDEDVLKVSMSMCSYGGKWGKDQPIKM